MSKWNYIEKISAASDKYGDKLQLLMDVVKEVNNLIDFINNKIYNINNRLDNSKVRLNNIEVENLNIELGCLYNERRDLEYIKNRLMAVLGV